MKLPAEGQTCGKLRAKEQSQGGAAAGMAGRAGAACRHPGSEVAVEEGGELALGDGAHLGAH